MKKILDQYFSVDRAGFDFVADHCNEWACEGGIDLDEVVRMLKAEGVEMIEGVSGGRFLVGVMYNPDLGVNGEVWVTSMITGISLLANLDDTRSSKLFARTNSGSEYLLLDPYTSFPADASADVVDGTTGILGVILGAVRRMAV
ncbi:hypothetical protein IIY24_01090 [Candidatus Saccharibacteria bacterium]|nr:hypothetical protein [Candidatus Saccharibacteria bacterium]